MQDNMQKNKSYRSILFQVLSGVIFLTCLLGTFFYVRARKNYTLSSDDSCSLVLAEMLASENRLLTKNWYYSTELRVLGTNVFNTLYFYLTDSWHQVRMLTLISLYLLLTVSYFAMSRAFRFRKYFFLTAAVLFIPFSDVYYHIVLKGTHYFPPIITTIVALTFAEFYLKLSGKKKWIFLVFNFILSALVGLGGARQLLVTYMPLCAAAGINYFFKRDDEYKNWLVIALADLLGAVIGYEINAKILAGIYSYETWSEIVFSGFDSSRIDLILNGFLFSFGYTTEKIFSLPALLGNAACMMWLLLTVYVFCYVIRNKNRVSSRLCRLTSFTAFLYLIFILFYIFTDAFFHHRYNLPVIVFSLPLIALFLEEVEWKRPVCSALLSVLVVMTAVCGAFYYKSNWNVDKNEELRKITDFLVSEGYKNGYSSYWRSNVVTEFSNGKIDVWDIIDDSNDQAFLRVKDIDQTYHWLQKVSHDTTHPEGKIFLLFTAGEYGNTIWKFQENNGDENIIYQSQDYVVLGYEDYNDMIDHLYPGYDFTFGENQWLENGQDVDGHRELYVGGVSFGPYQTFWPGNHEVVIRGKNLEHAKTFCVYDNGAEQIDLLPEYQSSTELRYTFVLDQKTELLETVVRNMSDDPDVTVILEEIHIRRK